MKVESSSRAPASRGRVRTRRGAPTDGPAESRDTPASPHRLPTFEGRGFRDVLRSLGHVVTVVNSDSYGDAPVGHRVRAGF